MIAQPWSGDGSGYYPMPVKRAPATAPKQWAPVAAPAPASSIGGQPATMANYLGGAPPQATAATIGGIPGISAMGVDPQSIMAGLSGSGLESQDLSQTGFADSITKMMAPLWANQQAGLNEQLSQAGISGGTSVGANKELARNQTEQLAGTLAPMQLQEQGMNLGRNEALAGYTAQDVGNNFEAQKVNAGNDLSAQQANQGASIQGQEFNANAGNQAQEFNINQLMQMASGDTNSYNQFLAQMNQLRQGTYLGNLNARAGLANNAQNNTGFQPIFQQAKPVDFSGVGGALAGGMKGAGSSPSIDPTTLYGGSNWSGGTGGGG